MKLASSIWLATLLVGATLATLFGAALWSRESTGHTDYDVIVVGASPGGIAASIQAARMGARVALLEQTDWVGGQMTTAGVGTMDEGNTAARTSGLYHEFVAHVVAYYQARHESFDTCYFSLHSLCVEPRVGQHVLRQMLGAEANHLTVITGVNVTGVAKEGARVTGVVVDNRTLTAAVVIDAEKYGDVMAWAGAPYRLGNATSDDATASPDACIQDITYSPIIKYYPDGVPPELRFASPPPGYHAALANHFAAFLSATGHELVRKNDSATAARPMSFPAYVAYRGLPDLANPTDYDVFGNVTRTAINFGNDYPTVGDLSTSYLTDPGFRARANVGAELLALQMLYYIQHDLGQTNWSIANDEGYNTTYNQAHHHPSLKGFEAFENQMPQEAYVREGRRLMGVETLTGNEVQLSTQDPAHIPRFDDSIAVGYYPMDLHGCRRGLESSMDPAHAASRGGAFEVPLGVVIPQTIDGLLVTDNNISTSREANGATREQPIAMDVGQAAGALAALAVQHHEQPREVPASDVRAALHDAHVVTDVPA